MASPYSFSASYNNPTPAQVNCPQCAGMGPNGFTALPELTANLPVYGQGTPAQIQAQIPPPMPTQGMQPQLQADPGRMISYGVNPNRGLIPQMPSNVQGTNAMPTLPESMVVPITDMNQPMPMTTESLQYMNGFLRTQIGRRVMVEFLIGTNTLVDRTGVLLGVGANYILLNESDSDDLLACDFYNIKFVKFFY